MSTDSPVILLSFTLMLSSATITPSAGMKQPADSSTTSPTSTASGWICTVLPARMTETRSASSLRSS